MMAAPEGGIIDADVEKEEELDPEYTIEHKQKDAQAKTAREM